MRAPSTPASSIHSSKKSASPRSVASWPGKYGYPSLACCGEAQTWRWESRTLQGGLGEEAAMAAAMVVAVLERSSRLPVVGVGKERRAREEAAVARGDRNRHGAAAGDDQEAIVTPLVRSDDERNGWLLPLPPHLAAARES